MKRISRRTIEQEVADLRAACTAINRARAKGEPYTQNGVRAAFSLSNYANKEAIEPLVRKWDQDEAVRLVTEWRDLNRERNAALREKSKQTVQALTAIAAEATEMAKNEAEEEKPHADYTQKALEFRYYYHTLWQTIADDNVIYNSRPIQSNVPFFDAQKIVKKINAHALAMYPNSKPSTVPFYIQEITKEQFDAIAELDPCAL